MTVASADTNLDQSPAAADGAADDVAAAGGYTPDPTARPAPFTVSSRAHAFRTVGDVEVLDGGFQLARVVDGNGEVGVRVWFPEPKWDVVWWHAARTFGVGRLGARSGVTVLRTEDGVIVHQ